MVGRFGAMLVRVSLGRNPAERDVFYTDLSIA